MNIPKTNPLFQNIQDTNLGFGQEAVTIEDRMRDIILHYLIPETRSDVSKRFYILAGTWLMDTLNISSTTQSVMHPSYQSIIGMGPVAVPLILKVMEKEPANWFWALRAITNEDPVKPEDKGNVKKMTNSWIEWGRDNGLA